MSFGGEIAPGGRKKFDLVLILRTEARSRISSLSNSNFERETRLSYTIYSLNSYEALARTLCAIYSTDILYLNYNCKKYII